MSVQSGCPVIAPICFSFWHSLAYILAPIAECQRSRAYSG